MSASASICCSLSAFGASSKVSCFIRTSRVSGRMISLSLAPRESFCTAIASSSPRNASIFAPVAVPFGAPFIPASVPVIAPFAPASALFVPDSAPASALPVSASAPTSALPVSASAPASALLVPDSPRLSFTSAFDGEASDGEAFNADFFNAASFSAVSAVSSAPVSAPIRCSKPAAIACGCHSHVFHINIADNAAAKIRFDFFLIPFSSH